MYSLCAMTYNYPASDTIDHRWKFFLAEMTTFLPFLFFFPKLISSFKVATGQSCFRRRRRRCVVSGRAKTETIFKRLFFLFNALFLSMNGFDVRLWDLSVVSSKRFPLVALEHFSVFFFFLEGDYWLVYGIYLLLSLYLDGLLWAESPFSGKFSRDLEYLFLYFLSKISLHFSEVNWVDISGFFRLSRKSLQLVKL